MKIQHKKCLLIFLISFFAYCKSYSDDRWKIISTNDQYLCYYDSQTIKFYQGYFSVWIKFVFLKPEFDDEGKEIEYEIDKWTIYCNSRRMSENDMNYYYKSGKYKNVYGSTISYEIVPESIGEDVYIKLCK